MSERFKEHAWKVCILQKGIQGSNPCLSAGNKKRAYHYSFDTLFLFSQSQNEDFTSSSQTSFVDVDHRRLYSMNTFHYLVMRYRLF